ncbi:hypothetical protein Cgig2_008179 [Carnegiea gigantea]|uniref:Uncharacterized protein n=1 Tax=Carnegiea gigantea TaxID=171969 RepID=A0A9Q1L277_9CARY|nr:hypothetical protein Cgig2_008179 [Carnegiea gigantea]
MGLPCPASSARRKKPPFAIPEVLIARSGSLRPPEMLSPLREGPDQPATAPERAAGGSWDEEEPLVFPGVFIGGRRRVRAVPPANMWYVELALVAARFMLVATGSLYGDTRLGLGLDPRTSSYVWQSKVHWGKERLMDKTASSLSCVADPKTLKSRSEGPAEIIRHVLFGYFSQKTGLLVHIEDSHLTRIQSNGGDAVYWETTINSCLEDYRRVEGIMIAHAGRSVVTLFRFGETAMSHTKTRMEEAWTIEEVAFNVPGLSVDCFIPPAEIRYSPIGESSELPQGERLRPMSATAAAYRAKVASMDRSYDNNINNMTWQMDDMHV